MEKPCAASSVEPQGADTDTAAGTAGATIKLTLRRLGGSCVEVEVGASACVRDLHDAIQQSGIAGLLGVMLATDTGAMLKGDDVPLAEFGVSAGSMLTMVTNRARDYDRASGQTRTIACERYPAGIHIAKDGITLVAHYYGSLSVYDASFRLLRTQSLPGRSPDQMVFAATGELLIAFAESSGIGVFNYDPQSHEITMQRWLGRQPGRRHEGIAVSGGRVFASDYNHNRVRVFSLANGASLPDIDHLSLRRPCGLDVIDDRLLAVADRGNDRVVLLDLETFEVVRQLPSEGAESGKGQLRSPNDVTVDSGGNLLVMDTGNERIAVFREDGAFVTTVMKGDFKDHGNTFCYMACNLQTGAIAVSNNDEHSISIFAPLFGD